MPELEDELEKLFEGCSALTLEQTAQWGELMAGELSNRYKILNVDGSEWGHALEKEGGLGTHLKRQALKKYRSMEMVISDSRYQEILRLKRTVAWTTFSKVQAFLGRRWIGSVRRRFSLLNRVYDIYSSERERMVGKIKSPLLRPWRFPLIGRDGRTIGRISKRWGGLVRESMSDADTFSVQFPSNWKAKEKALLLAAAFAVDMDFFEG